jgi:hypothetical protein
MDFKIPKHVDIKAVTERIKYPLSDADVERYFGSGVNSEVIKYSELANYNTIDELLPKAFDFRIILVEQAPQTGHWVLLMKYGNTIENFDSYGYGIEKQKNFMTRMINKSLGQDKNYLTKLIARSPYKYVVNKHQFQANGDDVNTCGRWTILRIITAKDLFMNLDEFTNMIKKASAQLKMPPDVLVTLWIN